MYNCGKDTIDLLNMPYRQVARIKVDTKTESFTLTEENILQGSLTIDRYSVSGSKIEIGSAIAAELDMKLKNDDGRFDDTVFEGAVLYVQIGVKKWDAHNWEKAVVHWIPCGYFIIDTPPRALSTISISALDRMVLFSKSVDANSLSFPMTVEDLINKCCDLCGVSCASNLTALPNRNYQIKAFPETSDELTYRQLLAWCAEITGTCAYMNEDGQLVLKWYEQADLTIGPAQRYNSDMLENDITITGVNFTVDGEDGSTSYVAGTTDYAFDMTGNALIQDDYQNVVDTVYLARKDFSYRPYDATIKPAPYLWPMDMIHYQDAKGVVHDTIVTHVTFTMNASTSIAGAGETDQNQKYQVGGLTANQQRILENIKNNTDKVVSDRQQAILHLNEMIVNSLGLYFTQETGEDGLSIYYFHNGTTLENSSIIYTFRSNGFAWTDDWNDGNPTWQYGFTKDGNAVFNALSAYKITSEYIEAHSITADLLSTEFITKTEQDLTDTLKTAEEYTDGQLKNYSTTTETKSLIDQKAESITLEVSKTYTTKTEFESVSSSVSEAQTKADAAQKAADDANAEAEKAKSDAATAQEAADKAKADAAAAQKAAEDAEANAANDATEKAEAARKAAEEAAAADAKAKAAQAEANAKTAAAEDAKAKADQALADAKAYTTEQLKNYSTTEQTKSLIDQRADSITLDVTKSVTKSVNEETDKKLADYSTTTEMESTIKTEVGKISLSASEVNETTNLIGGIGEDQTTVEAPTASGKSNAYTWAIPSSYCTFLKGKTLHIAIEYKVEVEIDRSRSDSSESDSGIIVGAVWAPQNFGWATAIEFASRKNNTKTPVCDWTTAETDFTLPNAFIGACEISCTLRTGTGKIQIKRPTVTVGGIKQTQLTLTQDGTTLTTSMVDTAGEVSAKDFTELKTSYDSLQATVVKDGEIRSKFAMDTSSVEISSGVITFSGNTLVVNSDNFKLAADGTVAITGTFTSEKDNDRAYIGDGEITLYKKIGTDWNPAVKIYSDGTDGSYLLGHVTVFGDKGADDKRIDLYTDQAGAKLDMMSADGTKFIKMYANGSGEGRLEIGGVNGLGELETKYVRVDGKQLRLMEVKYLNNEGTPVYQYFLAASGGALSGQHAQMV